jgi:hypothetical protein
MMMTVLLIGIVGIGGIVIGLRLLFIVDPVTVIDGLT